MKRMLDLTPIVDIIFIIIVFLLLTQSAPLGRFEVELPASQAESSGTPKTEERKIYLFKNGTFGMEERNHGTVKALTKAVEALPREAEITLIVEEGANAASLVSLMELLSKKGFAKISFITKSDAP